MNKYVSVTQIRAFKACVIRWRNRYIYGIKREIDTEIQRVGTNWHGFLEVLALTGDVEEVAKYIAQRYAKCPPSVNKETWERERTVLLYCVYVYDWYYKDSQNYETVATELKFKLPMIGAPDGVVLVGMIDKIVKNSNGIPMIGEHKSTSSDVSMGSDYWKGLALDVQSMVYLHAARRLQLSGELESIGIKATDPLISGSLYDAWHKPQIKPKFLSVADVKKFLKTKKYCGAEFEVVEFDDVLLTIDGVKPETERTAKDELKIRETMDMFGARLFEDATNNPTKYFGRRELSFTDDQMADFEKEMSNIYQVMSYIELNSLYYKDESACEERFKCDYIGACYNNIDILHNVPNGFSGPRKEFIDA